MAVLEPRIVRAGDFAPEQHFYPRVLNAQMHAMVRFFFSLSADRIISRYVHLNPSVDPRGLAEILAYRPKIFRWAGSDLMHVTTASGDRKMVVIETNSCPSGQKSMPLYEEHDEQGGYKQLVVRTLAPRLNSKRLPPGELAVIYDKNPMEASGYAAALAEHTGEPVYLTPLMDKDPDPHARFDDGVLQVRDPDGQWHDIRAAFRYVTQRPWNRIPLTTKTLIFNPVLACLAGGRNKAVAAKAYDFYNAEIESLGLEVRTPSTYWDVAHEEIPFWVRRLGGHAVVKVPYSNAGQGVFTITNEEELEAFMALEQTYDQYIVQSLIGNFHWSSGGQDDRLFHVGTFPNKHGHTYASDLRVMVASGPEGLRPLAIYARRAGAPLTDEAPVGRQSWAMLGTNLSIKRDDGGWDTDERRLMLMDRRDFNQLGVGIDGLIDSYIQTVLSVIAIDRMALALLSQKGRLRMKLFRSLNDDPRLLQEILQ